MTNFTLFKTVFTTEMSKYLKKILAVAFLLLASTQIMAQYTDGGDLSDDINDATIGGTYIVTNGTYSDFEISISERMATEADPIIIKAQTIGGVTLTGESYATFKKSAHITLEGFVFDCTGESTLVKLEGSNNIRITRNVFELDETSSVKWVYIGGVWDDTTEPYQYLSYNNRIDHNTFQNKTLPGHYITIDGTNEIVQSQYDRIDHNYFKNNSPRATNEQESIRIGWSEMSMSSGYTTVEFNLFEDCDGDPEIVSVKSCDNIIRHNTFVKSYGTLSLRHGNRNRVEGNYFFGGGKAVGLSPDGATLYTGGIRIYGKDHVIINNYMEGLNGTKWDAPITLTQGDAIDGGSSDFTKHFRAENVVLAYNTLVDNAYGIEIGFDNNDNYNTELKNIQFANNLVTGSTNSLVNYVEDQDQGSEITWVNNLMYPTGTASLTSDGSTFTSSQVLESNPNLVYDAVDGVWRSTASTPTITNGSSEMIDEDIEGQTRPTISNPGADHFSAESIRYAPLTDSDVGPYSDEGEMSETLYLSSVSDFTAVGGSEVVTVTSNVDWTVSENEDWIVVSPTSGSDNGSFTITVDQNTGNQERSGVVTVVGGELTRTVNVAQDGAPRTNLINTGDLDDPVIIIDYSSYEVAKENVPDHTLDKDNGTVWAAEDGSVLTGDYKGDGEYIIYDLGSSYTLDFIQFTTTNKGDAFGIQILVSTTGTDDSDFSMILPTSGDLLYSATGTTDFNEYEVDVEARYVKLIGYGRFNSDGDNRESAWTAIGEIEFFGDSNSLSVEEDEFASQLKVYPVPANGILNIKSQKSNVKSIKLFSIEGRMIFNRSMDSFESEIHLDVSSFSNGTYMLLLTNDVDLTHSKLIYIEN